MTDPAQTVFDYLYLRSHTAATECDLIVGFGHFDLRIAHRCGELWRAGAAPRILFTGGVGAGSADLDRPEAEAFGDYLAAHFPEIPAHAIMREIRSTNTGENIAHSLVQLAAAHWPTRAVALVASPYRQRRVALTWRKRVPHSAIFNDPPATTWAKEVALFRAKGQDLVGLLPGEIHRLTAYAERGWIEHSPLPPAIQDAVDRLARI